MDDIERRLKALEAARHAGTLPKSGVFEKRHGESDEAARQRAASEGYGAILLVPPIPKSEAEIADWERQVAEYYKVMSDVAHKVASDSHVDVLALSAYLAAEYHRITTSHA